MLLFQRHYLDLPAFYVEYIIPQFSFSYHALPGLVRAQRRWLREETPHLAVRD